MPRKSVGFSFGLCFWRFFFLSFQRCRAVFLPNLLFASWLFIHRYEGYNPNSLPKKAAFPICRASKFRLLSIVDTRRILPIALYLVNATFSNHAGAVFYNPNTSAFYGCYKDGLKTIAQTFSPSCMRSCYVSSREYSLFKYMNTIGLSSSSLSFPIMSICHIQKYTCSLFSDRHCTCAIRRCRAGESFCFLVMNMNDRMHSC